MKKRLLLSLLAASVVAVADTFEGTLIVSPQWTHSKTVGASTVSESFGLLLRQAHDTGTNVNQMTDVVVLSRTLAGSTNETINLAGGVTNSFGDVVNFSEVRFLAVRSSVSTNPIIELGGASTNQFASWLGDSSDTVKIAPSGLLLVTAPREGFSSTNGNLKVTNTGTNTASYIIYVGGVE
jgi:hypothetical protein